MKVHGVSLALLVVAGCAAPVRNWPFPAVAGADGAKVRSVLAERTDGVRALYAVLEMGFESPERSAVLDMVVRYQRPGKLRMTAFKDLLVAAHGVFDLVIDAGRFTMVTEVDGRPQRTSGPLEELGRQHPTLAAVAALREAMFLPGWQREGEEAAVSFRGDEVLVGGPAPSGIRVEWLLESRTLGVKEARLRPPEGEVAVRYLSYREARGRFIPERFEIDGPGAGIMLSGALVEVELNPDFGAEDFILPPGDEPDAGSQ